MNFHGIEYSYVIDAGFIDKRDGTGRVQPFLMICHCEPLPLGPPGSWEAARNRIEQHKERIKTHSLDWGLDWPSTFYFKARSKEGSFNWIRVDVNPLTGKWHRSLPKKSLQEARLNSKEAEQWVEDRKNSPVLKAF